MLDLLFKTYGNITAVDLEINLNTCAKHGIPNSQLNPCSSRFKIVQIALRQEASSWDPQQINVGYVNIFATGHFMSACRQWSEKHAIKKLGHNSNPTLLWLTVSKSKCRANLLQPVVTILPMPLLAKLKTKWLKPLLEHYPTLQRQPQQIEAWWQLSHRPTPVLSSSWRTTQTSCGNSKL
jgi:hypothetical protein